VVRITDEARRFHDGTYVRRSSVSVRHRRDIEPVRRTRSFTTVRRVSGHGGRRDRKRRNRPNERDNVFEITDERAKSEITDNEQNGRRRSGVDHGGAHCYVCETITLFFTTINATTSSRARKTVVFSRTPVRGRCVSSNVRVGFPHTIVDHIGCISDTDERGDGTQIPYNPTTREKNWTSSSVRYAFAGNDIA